MESPEDLGGDSEVGPSSTRELGGVTALDGVNDAQTSDDRRVFSPT